MFTTAWKLIINLREEHLEIVMIDNCCQTKLAGWSNRNINIFVQFCAIVFNFVLLYLDSTNISLNGSAILLIATLALQFE